MAIALYRIDDRLIHGQVVVGWGQPLNAEFIILVDDAVAESDWEQELYRMGVPPHVEVRFLSIADAAASLASHVADRRTGILLTGTVTAMLTLVRTASSPISAVNIGGIHYREDRVQKLRYVFLTRAEETELQAIAQLGVAVTAQDVPSARALPLTELLRGGAT